MAQRAIVGLALLALTQAGCGKTGQDPGTEGGGSSSAGEGSGTPAAVAGAGGDSSSEVPLDCPEVNPGPSPLGKLLDSELNRSFRTFVPQSGDKLTSWLPESEWDNDPNSEFSATTVDRVRLLAHDVAQNLTSEAAGEKWLQGCDLAAEGEEACRDALMEPLLERAYRRSVTEEDRAEMKLVFAEGKRIGGDFQSGMRAIVEVALQSPDFMFLIAQGNGKRVGDAVELTGFETAARLAYFLTGAPPDAQLFEAAKSGPFTHRGLEVQARRLLGSPENRATVRRFYEQLLPLTARGDVSVLGFSPELALATTEGAGRFIEDVTFDGAGTLRALLSEPSVWVNAPLATFYGYAGVSGTGFQKVELDAARYAGLLTQPAFLTATSHGNSTSVVARSMPILTRVLCYQPPPPPTDVPALSPPPEGQMATMRQRMTTATADPTCMTCHDDINPIGFALENFDATGKWRYAENGVVIDPSGAFPHTDAGRTFVNAADLMHHIAESGDAKTCFVHHWLEKAYRRQEAPGDACSKAQLRQTFAESDGDMVGLLAALAYSDNFRYRLKSELAP